MLSPHVISDKAISYYIYIHTYIYIYIYIKVFILFCFINVFKLVKELYIYIVNGIMQVSIYWVY